MRGLVGTPRLSVNGAPVAVLQGQGARDGSGLHARLPAPLPGSRMQLTTRLDLVLGGTESLSLAPMGQQNRFALASSWPHPRLAGKFPARQPRIGADGFSALWEISALAADAQRQYLGGRSLTSGVDAVSVSLVDPVNAYTQADRAIKYGILFVVLGSREGWQLLLMTGLLGGVSASALPIRSVLAQTLEEAAPLGREWANMKWRRGIENQRMADLGDGEREWLDYLMHRQMGEPHRRAAPCCDRRTDGAAGPHTRRCHPNPRRAHAGS